MFSDNFFGVGNQGRLQGIDLVQISEAARAASPRSVSTIRSEQRTRRNSRRAPLRNSRQTPPRNPIRDRGAKGPERKKGKNKTWEGNTDKVDREIERLKKKQQELERRINAETDEAKIKDLERQLSQMDRELRQKDNAAYRRQHTQVIRIS